MTDTETISKTITEEEIAEFIKGLDKGNEPKCQIQHIDSQCTVRVVARRTFMCGGESYMMCQEATNHTRQMIEGDNRVCSGCRRRLKDCWKIIPV